MNLGTDENLIKVILDTNILVSAVVYGGKPEIILDLVLEKEFQAVTSQILISELFETLTKKFNFSQEKIEYYEEIIEKNIVIIYPKLKIDVQKDKDDNRVIEAAVEGKCQFIVTGDKELLELGKYKKIQILTAEEFLREMKPSR